MQRPPIFQILIFVVVTSNISSKLAIHFRLGITIACPASTAAAHLTRITFSLIAVVCASMDQRLAYNYHMAHVAKSKRLRWGSVRSKFPRFILSFRILGFGVHSGIVFITSLIYRCRRLLVVIHTLHHFSFLGNFPKGIHEPTQKITFNHEE